MQPSKLNRRVVSCLKVKKRLTTVPIVLFELFQKHKVERLSAKNCYESPTEKCFCL